MPRTWTKVGEEYSKGKQEQITAFIGRLEWQTLHCEMGMMPGEGIKAAIAKFRIPHVSLVAVSSEMAPLGLYAVEGNYKNGRARLYLVDSGTEITPVATDFFPCDEVVSKPLSVNPCQ